MEVLEFRPTKGPRTPHVSSLHEASVCLHFKRRDEDGGKANQTAGFFPPLNPSSAEVPVSLGESLCFFHAGSAIT